MGEPAIALLVAPVLCAVYVFVGRVRFLDGVPRSRWLSAAGGGAMALHFLSSDYGMRLDHRGAYDRTARWVPCGALLAG